MHTLWLTNRQARRFLLLKQGLIGGRRFAGRAGALAYIRQAGCIQFDPIDVCGRNADLVLQSRVQGYRKQMLDELLYRERSLVDYFDKNLAIFPAEDWPYFAREREKHRARERSRKQILRVRDEVLEAIASRGPLCSADLGMDEKVDWYWTDTRLSRAALEHLYFAGELGIHHKRGTVKYYDRIENCLPSGLAGVPDPLPDDGDHRAWRVLRRIGAVGLLWNRASDAWLGIDGLKAPQRDAAFSALLSAGRILEVRVEGMDEMLYCAAQDTPMLLHAMEAPAPRARCEFLAPLDNLLWDRKLIRALFAFDYKWEIYTPQAQRRFGYYVLPVLSGDRFVARIEPVFDRGRGALEVRGLWYEPGMRCTAALEQAIDRGTRRFAAFQTR